MTHTSTEQERAEFDRLILETDGMKDTGVGWADRNPDGTYKHKQIQKHFLTWQAARRAPVEAVPQGLREAAQRAHDWMERQQRQQSKGGHATFDMMMLREERDALAEALAVAPQPPEAAPVQMPDALLSLEVDAHYIFNNPPGECPQAVRDVIEWYAGSIRQLLAAHGIQEQST